MYTVFCLRGAMAVVLMLAAAAADPPARAVGTGMLGTMTFNTVDGGEIYQQICQGCHMPDGRGAKGAGTYPALGADPALASSQFMALTILQGRRNMPAFGVKHTEGLFYSPPALTNEQVAAVINYVRTHFGNQYTDPITAAQVEAAERPH